jgi:hypothetical protein
MPTTTAGVGPVAESIGLVVRAPLAGETWTGTQDVRWDLTGVASDEAATYDIEYSRDAGRSWVTQARGLRNASAYRWDTRAVPNGVYRLRVTATTEVVAARATSAAFSVTNAGRDLPVVSLLQPRGGEVWWGTREVRWRVVGAGQGRVTIGLAYSVDEGANWRPFAGGLANTGSYLWDTTSAPNCERVWLRVSATNDTGATTDVCETPVAVLNPHTPLVALLSPEEGATVAGKLQVRWATAQEPGPRVRVRLEMSLDGGASWQSLAADLPATGSYSWDTTGVRENGAVLLRVVANDGLRDALDMTRRAVIVRGNPLG